MFALCSMCVCRWKVSVCLFHSLHLKNTHKYNNKIYTDECRVLEVGRTFYGLSAFGCAANFHHFFSSYFNHCWWQFSLTDDCLLIHLLISVPNFLQTQQIQSRQNWSRARSGKICFCCLREWRPLLLPQISQVRRREMGGSCAQLCFWYFHFRRNYSIRNSWLIASRTWVAISRSQTQRFTQEINHLN